VVRLNYISSVVICIIHTTLCAGEAMTPISKFGLDRLGGYAAAKWVRAIVLMNIQYIEELETLSDS